MVVVGEHDKHWMDGGPLTDRALQIVSASEIPAAVIPLKRGAGAAGVVVGVDGSEESLQAVDFAAAEADKGGDELTVVLAFRRPARWVENQLPKSGLAESILEEDRIVLAESVAGLGDKYPDLVVHQKLETDTEPAKALVDSRQGGPAPCDRQPRPWRLLPDGARLHGPRRAPQRAVPDHCHPGAQSEARGLTAGERAATGRASAIEGALPVAGPLSRSGAGGRMMQWSPSSISSATSGGSSSR